MYDIKNLTNEVQYLIFRSGKECFLAGKASLQGVRDSEITPVIKKMKQRKIISLHQVTGAAKTGSRSAAISPQKTGEADTKEEADTREKASTKSTTRGKK
jgi:hypothetical protein